MFYKAPLKIGIALLSTLDIWCLKTWQGTFILIEINATNPIPRRLGLGRLLQSRPWPRSDFILTVVCTYLLISLRLIWMIFQNRGRVLLSKFSVVNINYQTVLFTITFIHCFFFVQITILFHWLNRNWNRLLTTVRQFYLRGTLLQLIRVCRLHSFILINNL